MYLCQEWSEECKIGLRFEILQGNSYTMAPCLLHTSPCRPTKQSLIAVIPSLGGIPWIPMKTRRKKRQSAIWEIAKRPSLIHLPSCIEVQHKTFHFTSSLDMAAGYKSTSLKLRADSSAKECPPPVIPIIWLLLFLCVWRGVRMGDKGCKKLIPWRSCFAKCDKQCIGFVS